MKVARVRMNKILEVQRGTVKILSSGTCEYGYRAPNYCLVDIDRTCPDDPKKRRCPFFE